jgi:hypothetical protein
MTTEKAATISARILTLHAQGLSVQASMDKVLGQGAYGALVYDVWLTLRAKGGQ